MSNVVHHTVMGGSAGISRLERCTIVHRMGVRGDIVPTRVAKQAAASTLTSWVLLGWSCVSQVVVHINPPGLYYKQ